MLKSNSEVRQDKPKCLTANLIDTYYGLELKCLIFANFLYDVHLASRQIQMNEKQELEIQDSGGDRSSRLRY